MNEPNVTWQSRTEQGKDKIWQFVRHFCGFLKSLDPVQPITVGIAGRTDDSLVADLVDVLSLHSYRETGAELRRNLEETRKQAQTVGKPYLISECIAPGWGSPFEMVMPVIREQEIGYYFWELMIGKDQFRNITGVFYPDGSVRNKNHVRAIMADRYRQDMFEEKPRWDGVPINPFGKRYREVRGLELALKTFERMATSATTRQNFSERYTFLKSVVTLTWGGQDVFKPFHHQIRTALADVEQSASEGETSSPEDNKAIDDLLQRLKPELPGQTRAKIADWFMRW
jgi:hypothetical protein